MNQRAHDSFRVETGALAEHGDRWPRGLRRGDAARYVGVSTTKFDEWVSEGRMPQPKRIDRVVVWDKQALDSAFDALPDTSEEKDTWADL